MIACSVTLSVRSLHCSKLKSINSCTLKVLDPLLDEFMVETCRLPYSFQVLNFGGRVWYRMKFLKLLTVWHCSSEVMHVSAYDKVPRANVVSKTSLIP